MTWGIDLESTAMMGQDRHADLLEFVQREQAVKRARPANEGQSVWQRLRHAIGGGARDEKRAATPQSLLQS